MGQFKTPLIYPMITNDQGSTDQLICLRPQHGTQTSCGEDTSIHIETNIESNKHSQKLINVTIKSHVFRPRLASFGH